MEEGSGKGGELMTVQEINGNHGPKKTKLNINPNELPIYKCSNCSGEAFINGVELRILSEIISPSGKREVIQGPVLVCSLCGRRVLQEDLH